MKKKIFINIIILLLFSSCGYQPIYSSKNKPNLKINEIILMGDNQINKKIIGLLKINENTSSSGGQKLILKSSKKNEISSKDNSGNPLTYLMTINTNVKIQDGENIKEKNYNLSFSYSNKENKFDLSEYQKTVEQNLVISISEKILIFLNL